MAHDAFEHHVCEGGFWKGHVASCSPETKELLQVLMKESRLTLLQRKQMTDTLVYEKSTPNRLQIPKFRCPKEDLTPDELDEHLFGKRRSLDVIVRSGAYKPLVMPTDLKGRSTNEIERLQNIMIFGSENPPRSQLRPPQRDFSSIDEFQMILDEIKDRKKFLEDMERLGQAKEYRAIIESQISQRIYELKRLDRERAAREFCKDVSNAESEM